MENKITYTPTGIDINGEFLSLDEITKGVNTTKANSENLVVLTIQWPETRGCDEIIEQIALSKVDAERIKKIVVGKNAYFGEIEGKHSEVTGGVEEDEITIDDNIISVTSFLRETPSRHEYNHSFIWAVIQSVECGITEICDEDLEYLKGII